MLSSFNTFAQAVKIHEGPSFLSGICEPSISVDPTNPMNVYAASILDNFYQSADGGLTWTQEKISSPYGVWGDPCVITDQNGRIYYFHLSDPEGTNWSSDKILDRIVCQTKDGPQGTFNKGSFTAVNGKKHDKEWASIHPSKGTIALSWTQFDTYGAPDENCKSTILFSESSDGGQSWSEPVIITEQQGDCIDDDCTSEGAVPAYGVKNARYVGWALDGGIYFNRSLDGKNWEEMYVADQKDGWTQSYPGFKRANGMPVTVVDHCRSSEYYGRVYVCWGDKDELNGGEIWISSSDDAGDTWSRPARVSPDGGSADQFLPWVTVDPSSGHLYAVYYDRRNTEKDNETNTYLSKSIDGGQSWIEWQINNDIFFPASDVFMGDYNHISAQNGIVRPIWTEMNGQNKSVWTYLHNETK
ncbi:MAG TPA: glycosyl hydrolase [Cryomorphaceae bacterium]|nr:glycosyl hydrolase [Cryomorphaceae bacterium]